VTIAEHLIRHWPLALYSLLALPSLIALVVTR